MYNILYKNTPPPGLYLPRLPVPHLGPSTFASADMAELAAPAAPGVTMLRQGPFSLLQTEGVERITADLAKDQLGGVRK